MLNRNYYEILEISQAAEESEIRRAYLKASRQYHPDKNKSPNAEEDFKAISEAYSVLSNKRKRQFYNDGLKKQLPEAQARKQAQDETYVESRSANTSQRSTTPAHTTVRPETSRTQNSEKPRYSGFFPPSTPTPQFHRPSHREGDQLINSFIFLMRFEMIRQRELEIRRQQEMMRQFRHQMSFAIFSILLQPSHLIFVEVHRPTIRVR